MGKYIWLLPVIFMFHDMEEIIGIANWIRKNYDRIVRRFPSAERVLSTYKEITTAGMAVAVYEELLVLLIICLLTDLTGIPVLFGIWFGALLGFSLHLFIHIVQALLIRSYIPALITSILSIPPSIRLVAKSVAFISMDAPIILGVIIGIAGVAVNLKLAHMAGQWFQRITAQRIAGKKL